MGRIGRKVRKGLRKVARGLGKAAAGPIAHGASGVRAARQKNLRGGARTFASGFKPGGGVTEDLIQGTAEVTGATVETVNRRAGEAISAVLKAPAQGTGSAFDSTDDRGRAVRDFGRNLRKGSWRDAARNMGEGLSASAVMGVGGILQTGSKFMSARGAPVPEDLKAGLRRIFGNQLDYSDFNVTGGRLGRPGGGGSETAATATPHLVYLGRDGMGADRILYDAVPATPLLNATAKEVNYLGVPQMRPSPILVHELVHIWQYQHTGSDYMTKAMYQQIVHGDSATGGGAYDWISFFNDDPSRQWRDLPEEAQAEMIEAAYTAGQFDQPTKVGGSFITFTWMIGGMDWGPRLRGAVKELHKGRASV